MVCGAVTTLLCLAVVACGGVYKAGPPYRACGQVIGNPAGMAVFKLRSDKVPYGDGFVNELANHQFVEGSISGNSILELVSGCDHGANVTITPPTVRILAAVRTTDGRDRAIELAIPGGTAGTSFHGLLTVNDGPRVIAEVAIGLTPSVSTSTLP